MPRLSRKSSFIYVYNSGKPKNLYSTLNILSFVSLQTPTLRCLCILYQIDRCMFVCVSNYTDICQNRILQSLSERNSNKVIKSRWHITVQSKQGVSQSHRVRHRRVRADIRVGSTVSVGGLRILSAVHTHLISLIKYVYSNNPLYRSNFSSTYFFVYSIQITIKS